VRFPVFPKKLEKHTSRPFVVSLLLFPFGPRYFRFVNVKEPPEGDIRGPVWQVDEHRSRDLVCLLFGFTGIAVAE